MEDPYSEETKEFVEKQNQISGPYINSCGKIHMKNVHREKYGVIIYFQRTRSKSRKISPISGIMRRLGVLTRRVTSTSSPATLASRIRAWSMSRTASSLSPGSCLTQTPWLRTAQSASAGKHQCNTVYTMTGDSTINRFCSRCAWSHDGLVMAYSLSTSGSDWQVIKFRNVATGEDYAETLEKVKFSGITWTKDNKGVFYGCYPDHDLSAATGTDTGSLKNQKVYYHVLGTKQEEDVMCVEFPDNPKYLVGGVDMSECGRYLFVMPSQDCKYNLLYFFDMEKLGTDGIKGKFELVPIIEKFEADFEFITNIGSKCVFHTNKGAEKFKLVTIDMDNPTESKWTDLVNDTVQVYIVHLTGFVPGT